jgi:hypothetical protein
VDHLHTVTTSPSLSFAASTVHSNKSQEHIATLTGMLQKKQMRQMQKIVATVSQINNHHVKQKFDTINDKTRGHASKKQKGDDLPWMRDPPRSNPQEVKEWNKMNCWYFCASTCRCWSTMHSTNGFTHNNSKEISKKAR